MKIRRLSAIAALVAMFYGSAAAAGVFADDLGRCLVNSTSKDDRASLIRWLFVAASQHPAVKPIAFVTPAQQNESDKQMGTLFMKLLTESCKSEAQKALQTEGPATMQYAFEVLGKVAGQELFTSPEVAGNLKGLAKYIDMDKIKALSQPPAKPQ